MHLAHVRRLADTQMLHVVLFVVGITCFAYWIGRAAPAWAGAFLIFLPLQVIGLVWFEPPFISSDVTWLRGLPITLVSALLLTITVLFFRLGFPWAGRLLPSSPRLDGERYPALLLCIPASLLALLSFLPGDISTVAVAFYGCTYLTVAVLLVGIFELWQKEFRSTHLIFSLFYQIFLICFALLRGSSEIALLIARFSTPVVAGLLTLALAFPSSKRRGLRLALLILLVSLVSIGLISYSADQDNLTVLLYSAYNNGISGGGRESLLGSVFAIAGKLVARQDYNEMLRSLTTLDYRFLADSLNSVTYPLDSLLRLVGIRGYEHTIGQLLFFLREESRSLNSFPSANIPAGLVVTLLSRQSILLLFFVASIYAFLFSCFLHNDNAAATSAGRLQLIVVILSGEMACLFELTPEFGLQVASMALACLWGSLLVHGLLRRVVSSGPRQDFG